MNNQFEIKLNKCIPSLFTQRHAHIIYGLVRWLQPQICVEIGSFKGYMTAWIAKAILDNDNDGVLFAVDNFSLGTTASEIHNNLCHMQLANAVLICDANSQDYQLPTNHVDLAFIDGDHSYEGVRKDVESMMDRNAQCIILHDTQSWWGPRKLIESPNTELITRYGYSGITVPFDEGLTVLMKEAHLGPVTYTEENYPLGRI